MLQPAISKTPELPPGTPAWITPQLVAQTIRVWQPYYADMISTDEAIKMVQSVGQLFSVLRESRETVCRARAG
jgi:hypothetical protein